MGQDKKYVLCAGSIGDSSGWVNRTLGASEYHLVVIEHNLDLICVIR